MEALDILDRLNEIEVYYEPIFSADSQSIVAFQVSGKLEINGNTIDIVNFTYDSSVPEELRKETEVQLIKMALKEAKNKLNEYYLYLPCNPNLFMTDVGELYFQTIKQTIDESLLPKIYLVIPAHKYQGDAEELHHPIRYMKTYGVKIALDDIGKDSNLDQIFMLEPTVLMINIAQLNYDAWGSQSHVFTTIQNLAIKMGATLMFKDIKTDYQLHHAWKHGARYFKGEYLQKPSAQLNPTDALKERFSNDCKQFIATERKQLELKYEEMKKLKRTIATIVEQSRIQSNDEESLLALANKLTPYAFRFYICDEEGFQISPNIVRKNGEWEVEKEALGKNWSWRPYFLMNIIKLKEDTKGELSNIYSDIKTGELTRTFSMALDDNEYLFVDISYDYLYEHNLLY
ncbi:EAL-associated domain-containing protein [Ureibacillus sp. FSL K6-8385]|uniref:EAL domain-containing protein n=1 Tax=Ureibacillus terrenus TaxID=118246 RepID=A0A540UY63_9BACL|nr:EAL-associated domain-containing protein [Ureibacillus terrenus]MED3662577.1 EAL-associated domain-containing protein [Ureibacillus terrenus]MED3762849.1 EAL-associated domain-containing protein [Ureibacillus terrenus]TQE89422.1 EAL domain-containing protein [Ureibacillus terrenus]